jgi:hypothetical protein
MEKVWLRGRENTGDVLLQWLTEQHTVVVTTL